MQDEPAVTPTEHVTALRSVLEASRSDSGEVKAVRALLELVEEVGNAVDQTSYEAGYERFHEGLDAFAATLTSQRFLGGETPSEADLWLFALLVRIPLAYYPFYKLNRRRLRDMPVLGAYARDVYQWPGVAPTVDFLAIRRHYARLDEGRNPKRLVPSGGVPDLWRPHGRARLGGEEQAHRLGAEEVQGALRNGQAFVRGVSQHRHWIGDAGFPAEAGRYHLYVANNCPWCHRTVLTRAILGLRDVVSMDVLFYRRDPDHGWQFRPEEPGCTGDSIHGYRYIRELYASLGSSEKSLPVLYDKVAGAIVSNESADIIRMMNTELRHLGGAEVDLVPSGLRQRIDEINVWVYHTVNNGAYKAGFSSSQEAHDHASELFFEALSELDKLLGRHPYLCGDVLTEADVRLFPTVFRFDHVYYTRMKLNRRMVRDYPHLSAWRARMMAVPGVAEASNLEHCKKGYFGRTGNNLVPVGPDYSVF